jgi:hypothetical protein
MISLTPQEFSRWLLSHGKKVTPEQVTWLALRANHPAPPNRGDFDMLKKITTLLPPELLPGTTMAQLAKIISTATSDIKVVKVEVPPLPSSPTDDDYQATFPPRTDTDLTIRRARFSTIYAMYKYDRRLSEWRLWTSILAGLDYILASNLLLANAIHGYDWLELWYVNGALNSLAHWQAAASAVNSHLKKYPASEELRVRYAEAAGLTGYRNPPMPGFDIVEETRLLATGGDVHGLVDWQQWFSVAADAVQGHSKPKPVVWMTLQDFIASGQADTAGASSYGTIRWKNSEEHGRFKARKNMIQDLLTPAEITHLVLEHFGIQTSTAFVKPELGKLRVAVTGDIWTYYMQSYLNYLCGSVYLEWEGNTMDEGFKQQTERAERYVNFEGYGLPFDFAQFDHQPTQWEIKTLVTKYLTRGLVNVPWDQQALVSQYILKVVESFSNSSIIVTHEGKRHTFRQTGSLSSGIRLTSMLGNYWNLTMTYIARRLVRALGVESPVSSDVRGDDSAIFTDNYFTALLMRLALAAINAIGNDAKYGIHKSQTEFLRVWYSNHAYAFPNRVIPGIMQRKPWSNDPWSPEAIIEAQIEVLNTLRRRTRRPLPSLEFAITRDWTRIRRQSVDWLRLPRSAGGLGLLPWRGKMPSCPWPQPPQLHVDVDIPDHTYVRYLEMVPGVKISDTVAKTIQHSEFMKMMTTDDIRGVAHILRSKFREEVSKLRVEWTQDAIPIGQFTHLFGDVEKLKTTQTYADLAAATEAHPLFGRHTQLVEVWTKLQVIARSLNGFRPMSYMRDHHIEFVHDLHSLERRGLHRATALDFVFGKISGLLLPNLNSMLTDSIGRVLSRYVSAAPKFTTKSWATLTSVAGGSLAEALNSSSFVQRLWHW